MRYLSRLPGTRVGVAAGALLALAAGAWAAIPATDGAIHACYRNFGGDLRVVNTAGSCRRFETALDLGGPTRGYAYSAPGDVSLGTTSATVADLTLPAGKYLIHGKANLFNSAFGDDSGAFVPCDLRVEGTSTMLDQNAVRLEGPVAGTEANIADEALQAPLDVTASTHVLLECAALPSTGSASANVRARYRQLDAVQVDGLSATLVAPPTGGGGGGEVRFRG
jgi:hypothetical protein